MDVKSLIAMVDELPGSERGYPFGPGARVSKVGGKMFALISEDEPITVSLKCDPDLALELRAQYRSVQPGYHLNKRHWNTLSLDGNVPPDEIEELIEHSYQLVLAKLPAAIRSQLLNAQGSQPDDHSQ